MPNVTGGSVLIVGAGPTGLVLAIELARRGVPFRLIDRLREPLGWNRAIFIKSRTLEICAALGVADAFLERGQRVHGIDLYSEATRVGGYRFDRLDTPFPYILSLPEDETESILTDRLAALGGRAERGIEFVGLEPGPSGIAARLRSDDGERHFEAGWIVGTDGFRSPVRQSIDDAFDGKDYEQLWGVVDARIAGWRHAREITCVQIAPPIVIPFPLGKDRWRIYFRTDRPDADVTAQIGARLAAVSPGAELQSLDTPKFFHAHSRIARRFRSGRVLIAGDAAHVSNPIEGHGMNAGIQDAHNLGWKLALAVAGRSTGQLIDSYEFERQPVAQDIIESGDAAEARMFATEADARQQVIDFLATAEGQHFAAVAESELEFGYDGSPIVSEFRPAGDASGGTAIGFRVGEVQELVGRDGEWRLSELIARPEHTLFLLLGKARRPAVQAAVALLKTASQRHPGCFHAYVVSRNFPAADSWPRILLCDRTGRLHDRLAAREPTLALIRPDGHLGLRCAPPSLRRLHSHLRRLFA